MLFRHAGISAKGRMVFGKSKTGERYMAGGHKRNLAGLVEEWAPAMAKAEKGEDAPRRDLDTGKESAARVIKDIYAEAYNNVQEGRQRLRAFFAVAALAVTTAYNMAESMAPGLVQTAAAGLKLPDDVLPFVSAPAVTAAVGGSALISLAWLTGKQAVSKWKFDSRDGVSKNRVNHEQGLLRAALAPVDDAVARRAEHVVRDKIERLKRRRRDLGREALRYEW